MLQNALIFTKFALDVWNENNNIVAKRRWKYFLCAKSIVKSNRFSRIQSEPVLKIRVKYRSTTDLRTPTPAAILLHELPGLARPSYSVARPKTRWSL